MKPSELDALFREAVAAVDLGDVEVLRTLMTTHPELARERLDAPGAWLRNVVGKALDGFFQRPYLLWFVAEDPVRHGRLPTNAADVARVIIAEARRVSAPTLQEQLDYALTLVSWSWIARECGVQIALIDVLVYAGAAMDGNPNNALVNRNFDAAAHLIARGAAVTLAAAAVLGRWDDVDRLLPVANEGQRRFAFVLAALNGKAEGLRRLIAGGVNVNAPSGDLYSHGTPLHHAVSSGSLEAVQVLLSAGAAVGATDTAWGGTPLGWAEYYLGDGKADASGKEYAEIAALLRSIASGVPLA